MPMALAKDKLFPKILTKKNKKGFPVVSLVLGSILTSIVMSMNFSEGLVSRFEFLILLTTLSTLIPYLFVSIAYLTYFLKKKFSVNILFKKQIIAILGILYSCWAIFGSGKESIFYGTILLLIGVPVYITMKNKN